MCLLDAGVLSLRTRPSLVAKRAKLLVGVLASIRDETRKRDPELAVGHKLHNSRALSFDVGLAVVPETSGGDVNGEGDHDAVREN